MNLDPFLAASAWRVADPPDDAPDQDLLGRIRAEIEAFGPITFARYMERALYEPGLGYYRRPRPGPGTAGADFLTAPEADPLFGAAVGRLVAQAWDGMDRPDPFAIIEHGAGTGALAAGLLGGLLEDRSALLAAARYVPVEVEATRVAALVARLEGAGLAGAVSAELPVAADGAVLANEVLDALPVHRVIRRGDRLRELLVTAEGDALAAVEAEPTTPALAARLEAEGIALEDGQAAEICLALETWLTEATAGIRRGIVALIDYGEDAASLYRPSPQRRDGTVRTFAGHAVGSDPFAGVGRRDITAHVDMTAVRAAATAVGLSPLGETTGAELLAASGVGDLVAARLRRPGATLDDAFALRSALARLMDPRGLGGFRVLVFARGIDGLDLRALRRLTRPG